MMPVVKYAITATRIVCNVAGFEAIARIYQALRSVSNSAIIIDCARLFWIDAHLASALKSIQFMIEKNGNVVAYLNLNDNVKVVLQKNRFLKGVTEDFHKTTMPTSAFSTSEGVKFSQYSRSNLSRKEMPRMSRALEQKFFEGIDEIFANASLHSNSRTDIVVGGQFFPTRRRLDFSISDGGRGIQGSIRDALRTTMKPDDAIAWAMTRDNTTRQGDIPGGLGSVILRDFVTINGGKLIVVSNGGFWCQDGIDVTKRQLKLEFPGTTVILEINTADNSVYDLAAPKAGEIW